MKRFITRLAVVATAGAMAAVLPASSAFAVNRTDCDELGLLMLHNSGGSLCFANAGAQSVAIYGVDRIWTGNNKVTLEYVPRLGAPTTSATVDKWQFGNVPGEPIHKITKIVIW
ncbi:beta/gamma crystallin domain-containing protein [Kitasatospora phosalacinea]|uniref:beta/gamma crystallin domain-containing protein n=1 Tax=Kitasatospora phosalacinea TaxID=2065 RepID=UPI000690E8B5|nr:beta/gamma crystallin domain-containing protein [Kitasatospora phosalacinea]